MDFNHSAYKESLVKILDIAREGHLYLLDRNVAMIVDVSKTYLWTASVILAVAMFLIKDIGLSPFSGYVLTASLCFNSAAFLLALCVLWGRGKNASNLYRPLELAEYAYNACANEADADSGIYAGLIKTLDECNVINQATNMKRVKILRTAAPCLFLSFVLLVIAVLLRLWHV